MHPDENEFYRFGSARFSDEADIDRAGYFKKGRNSLFLGFYGERPLYGNGPGGMVATAGARGGKLRDLIAYNVCAGMLADSMLILDPKGEFACIAANQTLAGRFCVYWNPLGLHGLPQDRINPVDYIRQGSPTLVADIQRLAQNLIVASGAGQSVYFEAKARQIFEAAALTLVWMDGVLTLPRLYWAINLILRGGDAYLTFAFEMSEAGYEITATVEEEIASSRNSEGGGYKGILGELSRAVSALSDPTLMASVSPPFTMSLADLCASDRAYQLYICPPADLIDVWAPVIKAIFVGAYTYKSRAPRAPQQTWILDECAQLGGFPLVPKLFSIGAGLGVRPVAIFQNSSQMAALAPRAEQEITASAAIRVAFAIRDPETAATYSRMIGAQTLQYDDDVRQAAARFAQQEAIFGLLNGEDPVTSIAKIAHHGDASLHRSKQHRMVRTPDEILNTPPDKIYIFGDCLPGPIYADRKAYFGQRFMAGRFLPNPYHPPLDRVRIKTRFGHEWRRVITEPVSPAYASWPQYSSGLISYVEGFRP